MQWAALSIAHPSRVLPAFILCLYFPMSSHNLSRRFALDRPDREMHDMLAVVEIFLVLLLPRARPGMFWVATRLIGTFYMGKTPEGDAALKHAGVDVDRDGERDRRGEGVSWSDGAA